MISSSDPPLTAVRTAYATTTQQRLLLLFEVFASFRKSLTVLNDGVHNAISCCGTNTEQSCLGHSERPRRMCCHVAFPESVLRVDQVVFEGIPIASGNAVQGLEHEVDEAKNYRFIWHHVTTVL
jgi:hypothetical protein